MTKPLETEKQHVFASSLSSHTQNLIVVDIQTFVFLMQVIKSLLVQHFSSHHSFNFLPLSLSFSFIRLCSSSIVTLTMNICGILLLLLLPSHVININMFIIIINEMIDCLFAPNPFLALYLMSILMID